MSELEQLRIDKADAIRALADLRQRIAELQDQIVRLIEAGHLMAEVSTDYRRKIWLEAVKEAIK